MTVPLRTQPAGAFPRRGQLTVHSLEDGSAGIEHDFLIVDDQNPAPVLHPALDPFPGVSGKRTVKVVPAPGSLVTVICPLCSLTIP